MVGFSIVGVEDWQSHYLGHGGENIKIEHFTIPKLARCKKTNLTWEAPLLINRRGEKEA